MWVMQNRTLLNALIDDQYYWLFRDSDTHIEIGDNLQSVNTLRNRILLPMTGDLPFYEWSGNYNNYESQDASVEARVIPHRRKKEMADEFEDGIMNPGYIIGNWLYDDARDTLDEMRNISGGAASMAFFTTTRGYKNDGSGWALDFTGSDINLGSLNISQYPTVDDDDYIAIRNIGASITLSDRAKELADDGGVYLVMEHDLDDVFNYGGSDYDFGLGYAPMPTETHNLLVPMVNTTGNTFEFITDYTIGDLTPAASGSTKHLTLITVIHSSTGGYNTIIRSTKNE